jgi:hypothetical protein
MEGAPGRFEKEGEGGARLAIQAGRLYRQNVPLSSYAANRFALLGGLFLLIISLWAAISVMSKRMADSQMAEITRLQAEARILIESRERKLILIAEAERRAKQAEEELTRLKGEINRRDLELRDLEPHAKRVRDKVQTEVCYCPDSEEDVYLEPGGQGSDVIEEESYPTARPRKGDTEYILSTDEPSQE